MVPPFPSITYFVVFVVGIFYSIFIVGRSLIEFEDLCTGENCSWFSSSAFPYHHTHPTFILRFVCNCYVWLYIIPKMLLYGQIRYKKKSGFNHDMSWSLLLWRGPREFICVCQIGRLLIKEVDFDKYVVQTWDRELSGSGRASYRYVCTSMRIIWQGGPQICL